MHSTGAQMTGFSRSEAWRVECARAAPRALQARKRAGWLEWLAVCAAALSTAAVIPNPMQPVRHADAAPRQV